MPTTRLALNSLRCSTYQIASDHLHHRHRKRPTHDKRLENYNFSHYDSSFRGHLQGGRRGDSGRAGHYTLSATHAPLVYVLPNHVSTKNTLASCRLRLTRLVGASAGDWGGLGARGRRPPPRRTPRPLYMKLSERPDYREEAENNPERWKHRICHQSCCASHSVN